MSSHYRMVKNKTGYMRETLKINNLLIKSFKTAIFTPLEREKLELSSAINFKFVNSFKNT